MRQAKQILVLASLVLAASWLAWGQGGNFPPGSGSSAFNTITGGTNTNALVVGTGGSLTTSGSGTITATAVPLSGVSGATGTQTAASGNNPILWNWAQTTDAQAGMTFGETSAATNGTITSSVANQSEVNISTASGSTAAPLTITQGVVTGTNSTPALQVLPNWNNGSLNGVGLLIKATDTASGSSTNLIQAMDGSTNEFLATKTGTIIFGNSNQIIPGATIQFFNNNGTILSPIKTGGVTAADNGGAGAFGSNIFFGPSACETNFGPTTLNTGATTTTTGLSCLPANSIIDSVVGRVTTAITGSCTGWEFGDGTTAARFTANNTGLTLGSTSVPNSGTAWTTGIASTTTGMSQTAASAITITCAGGNPSAGAIRVIVYYHKATSPTS